MSDVNKFSKVAFVTLYGLLLLIGSGWRVRVLSRGQLASLLGLPVVAALWSILGFYLLIFAGH